MAAIMLLLSGAVMAVTPETASPGVARTNFSKDNLSTPLMQYGYGKLNAIAYSPDGTKFLTGSSDGKARLWDLATGQVLRSFAGHTARVVSVAISPDGTKVLTGAEDATAKLWNTATGELIHTFSGNMYYRTCVAFSPDGTKVLTGSNDGTIRLWDTSTGAEIRVVGRTGNVACVAFSPDGTKVLSGATYPWDYRVKLWDAATGTEIFTLGGFPFGVASVAFSPDGTKALAVGNSDTMGTATMWDTATGTEVRSFTGHTSYVLSAAFSPDGTKVLTGSEDSTATMWNADTGAEIHSFVGHTSDVNSLAFSPDGTKVLTGSRDNTAKLWDTANGMEIHTFTGFTGTVNSVSLSPDGAKVLTGGDMHDGSTGKHAGEVRMWNAATGAGIRNFAGFTGIVFSAAFSPDGTKVFAGGGVYDSGTHRFSSGEAELWDAATGAAIHSFSGFTEAVNSVAYSPDGTKVLTGGRAYDSGTHKYSGEARLWDVATEAEIRSFTGLPDSVASVAFSPDGTKVFAGVSSGAVKLWDAASGAEVRSFTGFSGYVLSVAFSPDATKVLAGGSSGTVKLWDAVTGAFLSDFTGHADTVLSVAFSPDGTKVLTGSYRIAKLWDVAKALELRSFIGHFYSVSSVAFHPDGTTVLTGGSYDGTAKLWSLTAAGDVPVPDLVGKTQAAAATLLADANLSVGSVTQSCSDMLPAGMVLSQNPPTGHELPVGSTVALVVSSGPCPHVPVAGAGGLALLAVALGLAALRKRR